MWNTELAVSCELRARAGTCNGETTCRDDFYSDPVAVGYYKDHVKMWLSRRNTFTGRLYRCARPAGLGGQQMSCMRVGVDVGIGDVPCVKHRCKALVAAVVAPMHASGCGHVHQHETCAASMARSGCAAPDKQRISAWGRACVPVLGRRMFPHGV